MDVGKRFGWLSILPSQSHLHFGKVVEGAEEDLVIYTPVVRKMAVIYVRREQRSG